MLSLHYVGTRISHRTSTISYATPSILNPARSLIVTSVEGWNSAHDYMSKSLKLKKTTVPAPRGDITTPKEFLTKIGRSCGDVADKFKSWDHLFTATSDEMADKLAIPVRKRKYILQWREWFKRGIDLRAIELPKRSLKHLRVRKQVELARLQKQGLA